jgi:polyisoprenoid-binding protein YceI
MHLSRTLLLLLLATVVTAAEPAPRQLEISPHSSEVAFRAYKLGLLPIDGQFTRFAGWLSLERETPASCRVELRVEVASLKTEDPSMAQVVTGPELMDAARFPFLWFVGRCQGQNIGGELAMHGLKRPCELSLEWRPDAVIAEGHIVRADWGISAMPLLAGKTVRIRVSVPLRAQPSHGGEARDNP